MPTYAFPLHEVAQAFAFLADPEAVRSADPRSGLAPALTQVRDAMLACPEMVAGNRDRLDTSVMKAMPGRVVAKGGVEGLRAFAILRGARAGRNRGGGGASRGAAATGVAVKIEDGDGFGRAGSAASVEALRQVGLLDAAAARALARYHRPAGLDPRGHSVAEALTDFQLAPVGELLE